MKTNYDKLFDVLIKSYNEKQIEEIWEWLKRYDKFQNKLHKQQLLTKIK